jgi:hypothetical protein
MKKTIIIVYSKARNHQNTNRNRHGLGKVDKTKYGSQILKRIKMMLGRIKNINERDIDANDIVA